MPIQPSARDKNVNIHIWMPGDLGVPEWVLGWAYSDMDALLPLFNGAVSNAVAQFVPRKHFESRAILNLEPA